MLPFLAPGMAILLPLSPMSQSTSLDSPFVHPFNTLIPRVLQHCSPWAIASKTSLDQFLPKPYFHSLLSYPPNLYLTACCTFPPGFTNKHLKFYMSQTKHTSSPQTCLSSDSIMLMGNAWWNGPQTWASDGLVWPSPSILLPHSISFGTHASHTPLSSFFPSSPAPLVTTLSSSPLAWIIVMPSLLISCLPCSTPSSRGY